MIPIRNILVFFSFFGQAQCISCVCVCVNQILISQHDASSFLNFFISFSFALARQMSCYFRFISSLSYIFVNCHPVNSVIRKFIWLCSEINIIWLNVVVIIAVFVELRNVNPFLLFGCETERVVVIQVQNTVTNFILFYITNAPFQFEERLL